MLWGRGEGPNFHATASSLGVHTFPKRVGFREGARRLYVNEVSDGIGHSKESIAVFGVMIASSANPTEVSMWGVE